VRLFILLAAVLPAVAQNPGVRLTNASRPVSRGFQIGDRFEVVITGAPDQPVSVRTTMTGRTDWGPVIGRTDSSGRWATVGQFAKEDFGHWSEVWTVGGRLAGPELQFSVGAPCLEGGHGILSMSGPNMGMTCETAEGRQTFTTPSGSDPFRTPDGRLVPGRMHSNRTVEQYRAEIMQSLIVGGRRGLKTGVHGDEAGALILKIVGVNALSEDETRNVLEIVRAAFDKPDRIPEAAKEPSETLRLLRHLADSTSQESLQRQIAETMADVQAR
jgi:hypothetical protein